MMLNCDRITPKKIKKILTSSVSDIIYYKKTDSTNARAKMSENKKDFSLFVADCQTNGRGRMGRAWSSEKGKGVFMSILIKNALPSEEISKLTLISGLGVLRALKSFGIDAKIKWPNDIVASSKKLSGILAEAFQHDDELYVVVGIGINVLNKAFPEEIKKVATSVLMESGKKVPRAKIIARVTDEIKILYDEFLNSGLDSILKEYKENCITLDKEVKIIASGEEFLATAVDITSSGELLVERNGEEIKVLSGEVSVRGIYEYV